MNETRLRGPQFKKTVKLVKKRYNKGEIITEIDNPA